MTQTWTLAAFPKYPDFGENVSFILIGFFMVVAILLLLSAITALVGRRFAAHSSRSAAAKRIAAAATPAAKAAAAPAPTPTPAENPHLPYLLAAAVDAALKGQAHRIVNVRIAGDNWAREGRRDIFGSHRVR